MSWPPNGLRQIRSSISLCDPPCIVTYRATRPARAGRLELADDICITALKYDNICRKMTMYHYHISVCCRAPPYCTGYHVSRHRHAQFTGPTYPTTTTTPRNSAVHCTHVTYPSSEQRFLHSLPVGYYPACTHTRTTEDDSRLSQRFTHNDSVIRLVLLVSLYGLQPQPRRSDALDDGVSVK